MNVNAKIGSKAPPQSQPKALFAAQGVLHVRPVVNGVVRRVVGWRDAECEDITQSAIERVLETLQHAVRRDGSVTKWAAVVARNVAVDALRARSRERRLVSREEDAATSARPAAGVDPERLLLARERLREFERGLDRLRTGHAQVVYMHDVLGHDLAEIAAALGISTAAAQSRLVRGRRQMAPRRTTVAAGARAPAGARGRVARGCEQARVAARSEGAD
ncbi:MAG TPA: sigma-70 family RNA polymerase sigma factor [Polyangiaceae bacterium]|nr:sigma-70 family RNA polymerase sigma factor [Polyangiaceae bacterium]